MIFVYRRVFKVENTNDLTVKLPDEYLNKEVEVIAFIVDKTQQTEKPTDKDFEDAMKFFDSTQIDMSNFKFDRDEANER